MKWFNKSDESKFTPHLLPGTVVTVKYYGINIHGKLQQPMFYRIRTDITWKDALEQYELDKINKINS